jgi:hypothetical protein
MKYTIRLISFFTVIVICLGSQLEFYGLTFLESFYTWPISLFSQFLSDAFLERSILIQLYDDYLYVLSGLGTFVVYSLILVLLFIITSIERR